MDILIILLLTFGVIILALGLTNLFTKHLDFIEALMEGVPISTGIALGLVLMSMSFYLMRIH